MNKMIKRFLLTVLFVVSLVSTTRATTNTTYVVSTNQFDSLLRSHVNYLQFDTNVWPLTITNVGGLTIGFETTQFVTNGSNVTIVSGVELTNVNLSGNTLIGGHILGGTNTIVYSWGPAAGASPSAGPDTSTILTADTCYTIDVTIGAGPTANSILVTNTFATPYGRVPHVVFSPSWSNACQIPLYVQTATISNVTFAVGNVAMTNTVRYKWTVHVIE